MKSNLLALTKQVYFNRNGILLLIVILIASIISILAYMTTGIGKEIYIAISTGLYSTAAFSFLQTMITGLRYEEVVSQSIEESVRAAVNRALVDMDSVHREFLPVEIFSASDAENSSFNASVYRDLVATKRYTFFGVTGRYALARIISSPNILDEAHIIIANPFSKSCIDHRVRHVAKYSRSRDAFSKNKQRIIEEILETVSGGPLAAMKCKKLSIYFVTKPIVDRFEMFDQSIYLTLFSDEKKTAAKFPRTLKFLGETCVYKILSTLSGPDTLDDTVCIVFTPEMELDTINEKLTQIGGSSHTIDLEASRSSFERFLKTITPKLTTT